MNPNSGAFSRRRWLGACLVLPLAACQSLQPGPRHLELSETRLLALLAGRFPMRQRTLGLLDVTLEQPRLRLIPSENRLGTELDYGVRTLLPGLPALRGVLGLSYGLRFEPTDGTVRLTQVRLERLGVDGLSAAQATQVQQLMGALVAGDALQDMVLHQVKAEDLEAAARRGLRPGALTVVPGGLRLALEPLPR